jgi:hypothetical protein
VPRDRVGEPVGRADERAGGVSRERAERLAAVPGLLALSEADARPGGQSLGDFPGQRARRAPAHRHVERAHDVDRHRPDGAGGDPGLDALDHVPNDSRQERR